MWLDRLDRLVTRERARVYSLMLVVAYVGAATWWLLGIHNGLDRMGEPLGCDFVTFYAASRLALQGVAAAVFDHAALLNAEQSVAAGITHLYAWHYPPVYELVVWPLATLPYAVAFTIWTVAGLGVYLALMRTLNRDRLALLCAIAFPAVLMNAMDGQNAFFTTAVVGFGLTWLDRRPWLAGAILSLLICKPQLAVLVPLLLIVQWRWRTMISGAASAVALVAASYFAFGLEPWRLFVGNLGFASQVLQSHAIPWEKMPTVFVATAGLGAPVAVAYAIHGLVAVAVVLATLWAWRRPGDQRLKIALAVPAMLLISPYCFDYDLVLLAIPIALVADHARHAAVPSGVRAALVLAFITPIAFTALARATGVQLMPLGVLALYAAVWRTLYAPPGSGAPQAA